jgi:hypothetical protein
MPAQIKFDDAVSYEKFGKLVKQWATDPNAARPATAQELQQKLNQEGVKCTVPPNITNVQFLTWRDDPNTLTILLPPATAIRDADRTLQGQRGRYELPPFYRPAFGKDPNVDYEEFNAQRIGEYCINQCQ